jgi:hypothetical protein
MSIEAVGSVPVTFDRDDGFRVPGHVHFDPKAHTSGLPELLGGEVVCSLHLVILE